MLGWFVRGALTLAGIITGWFVAKDAVNFTVIQMTVAVLLIALVVFAAAFWPPRWTLKRRPPH